MPRQTNINKLLLRCNLSRMRWTKWKKNAARWSAPWLQRRKNRLPSRIRLKTWTRMWHKQLSRHIIKFSQVIKTQKFNNPKIMKTSSTSSSLRTPIRASWRTVGKLEKNFFESCHQKDWHTPFARAKNLQLGPDNK